MSNRKTSHIRFLKIKRKTIKFLTPYNKYQVGGSCQNCTGAAFEDISPMNGDALWFPSSADTAYSSLSVPVYKHFTSFTIKY